MLTMKVYAHGVDIKKNFNDDTTVEELQNALNGILNTDWVREKANELKYVSCDVFRNGNLVYTLKDGKLTEWK